MPRIARKSNPTAAPPDGPDFGDLVLHHPQQDELFIQLYSDARSNTTHPGEAWARIEAKLRRAGRRVKATRFYHMNINDWTLVVTEFLDGEMTGRRTMDVVHIPPTTPSGAAEA